MALSYDLVHEIADGRIVRARLSIVLIIPVPLSPGLRATTAQAFSITPTSRLSLHIDSGIVELARRYTPVLDVIAFFHSNLVFFLDVWIAVELIGRTPYSFTGFYSLIHASYFPDCVHFWLIDLP